MKKLRRFEIPIRFDPSASDYQKYVFEIAIFVAVVLVILLNLPFAQVPVLTEGEYVAGNTDFPLELTEMVRPTKAGWPLTFYHRHQFSSVNTISDWHFGPLLLDGLISIALIIGTGIVFWPRRARLRRSKRIKKGVIHFAVGCGVAVLLAAYFGWLIAAGRADALAADRMRPHGTVVRVAYVPQLIASVLPESMARARLRIAMVDLQDPTNELVDLALEQPELRSLRLRGDTYDTNSLAKTDRLGFLQDLAVQSATVGEQAVSGLQSCALVSCLNLTGSQLDEDALTALADMPRLSCLSLFESNLELATIAESPLRKRLSQLHLSRPDSGPALLNLSKWYRLRELSLLSRSDQPNPTAVTITAVDLPQLETIRIDPLQKLLITGTNLPLLQSLQPQREAVFVVDPAEVENSSEQSFAEPSEGLWVQKLQLYEAGNVRTLVLDGRDIGLLDIEDCDDIESLTILGARANRYSPIDESTGEPTPISAAVRKRVISAIGDQVKGVRTVRLPGMELSDVSLEPLTYNVGITRLDLGHSNFELERMKDLREMRQLRHLELMGVPLEPQTFVWINRTFPRLENLSVSHEYARRVLFTDHTTLTGLTLDEYDPPLINQIKLVNLKDWTSPITVSDDAKTVRILNVPELTGLGIPTACDVELERIPGLKWFASGGENCDDATVLEILKAEGMQRLWMIHPSASVEALSGIRDLNELVELNVSGANLDDEFLANWKLPKSIRVLIADDCPITDTGFTSLLTNEGWTTLSLARTGVSANALRSISNLNEMKVLGLAGLNLDAPLLEALSKLPELTHLDLHGASLPPNAVELLGRFPKLRQLNLAGCGLSEPELGQLADNQPELELTTDQDSWDFVQLAGRIIPSQQEGPRFSMPLLRPERFKDSVQALTSSR